MLGLFHEQRPVLHDFPPLVAFLPYPSAQGAVPHAEFTEFFFGSIGWE
jgi:hypothetical protein